MTADVIWQVAVPVAGFVAFMLVPLVGLSIVNSIGRSSA